MESSFKVPGWLVKRLLPKLFARAEVTGKAARGKAWGPIEAIITMTDKDRQP